MGRSHSKPKAPESDEFWAEVAAFYEAGNGFIKCGDKFGLNWQTVRNHLKERGVKIRPSPARDYWSKREIIREVEVVKEVIVEVPQQPQPVEAPPTPKRRIVGSTTKYEGK